MAIVKGSKLYPVKVVEHRPLGKWLTLFVCLVLAALAVYLAGQEGYARGMAQQETAIEDLAELRQQLSRKSKEVADLEQRFANINLGAEVDRQATEEIRQEVIALKEKIAVLEEENSFYRGLMAPTENKRGLTFGSVELSETDRPRVFTYKVVMQQLATDHQLLTGTLSYTIIGQLRDVEHRFALRELSPQVDADQIRLRFKYFQNLEGELTLPEGFEPMAIELVAKSSGKDPVTVEKRFGWLVEEVL